MYKFYRVYLLVILSVISVIAQEPLVEATKPAAKQQSTTWSRTKRWGKYAAAVGATLLGSFFVYKQFVGNKSAARSLDKELNQELKPILSLDTLDKTVNEYKAQGPEYSKFIDTEEGKRIVDETRSRIENNIKQAREIAKRHLILVGKPRTDNTKEYMTEILGGILYTSSTELAVFVLDDEVIADARKLLEFGAEAKDVARLTLDKFISDYINGDTRQVDYDRELIKLFIKYKADINPTTLARALELDEDLREYKEYSEKD